MPLSRQRGAWNNLYGFEKTYAAYLSEFEEALKKYCEGLPEKIPTLKQAMVYSVMLGGKRIRPVLMLAAADMLGVPSEEVMPFAVAIEWIHTYSLIHDDLPAMDNDDYRRGKPSNHKIFGEAMAVLAGDALLNAAYDLCFTQCFKGEKYVRASKYLSEAAGENGMIAGQSADILWSEKEQFTEEDLRFIYAYKTGKLLVAPLAIASILADDRGFLELEEFGRELGRLFQLTDDILDVTGDFGNLGKTVGKDKEEGKLTCVRLYGLEQSRIEADLAADACLLVLERLNTDTSFLRDLVHFVRERKK